MLDRSHCGAVLILAHFHSFSKILVHRSCEILSEVVYNRSPRDLSSISRTSRRFPILRPTYFSTITDTPSLELTHFSRTIQSHPRPTCLNSSHLLASHFLNTSHLCSPLLSSSTVFSATLPFHTHGSQHDIPGIVPGCVSWSQDAFRKPCAATRTEAPMDIWSKAGRSMGALRSNRGKPTQTAETDGDRWRPWHNRGIVGIP